jgi:predicted TPR repeat methyltransferase
LSGTGRPERSQSSYRLQSAYAAKDGQEAAELYDSWAEDYERRVSSWGYITPAVVAWFLGRYAAPEDGTVLDAGAGTGLMGLVLAPLGYRVWA